MKRLAFVAITLLVFATYAIQTAGKTSKPQEVVAADSESCGFFNIIEIPDAAGDASPGSPPYVDILAVNIRQMGQWVQFELVLAGNPHNEEQYYFLFFDTDRNPETGQNWGGAGAEVVISIETFTNGSTAMVELGSFDANGEPIQFERGIPVATIDTGFIFNLEKSKIPSDHFNLYFEASGFPPLYDGGTLTEIQLQAAGDPVHLQIDSPNTVLESKPKLINIPQKSVGVQLTASLVSNGSSTPIDPSQVLYSISHQDAHVVPDPESIISTDAGGVAHYNSEGYVTATATDVACHLNTEKILLATGDVYGNPLRDDVIAVFPTDFIPDSSTHSFGDMMSGYPDMMKFINIGYAVTSEMYKGFRPLNGDKQILAPLVIEDVCGGPGNPLATAPCCYMNCGDASPQYDAIVHEMGHNFSTSKAMQQLLWSDQGQIGSYGFSECVASLPVIYLEEEIRHNAAAYGISPGSFEYEYSRSNREFYCSEPLRGLPEFERLITDGQTEGVFDNNGLFDGVQVFCSFFESFSCDYIDGPNNHKHHMVRRFLNIFDDTELPEFIPEKVETYFAAAYSTAAGRDMRLKLKFWGFDIDDDYYEQIEALIKSKLPENLIFQNGFE